MERTLCVVRELTDGSRRGAGRTTHKVNWTKLLGRGGRPLEDLKSATAGMIGAVGLLDAVGERAAGEHDRVIPLFSRQRHAIPRIVRMNWRYVVGSVPSSTRCGVMCVAKPIRAGYGTPLVRRASGMEECRKTLGYTGTP
jgi:hypothetical protein